VEKKSFWQTQLTRRDFIVKGLAGLAGVGVGAYLLERYLKRSPTTLNLQEGAPKPELGQWSHEAYHYSVLGNNVQCHVCPNQCLLEEGKRSICRNKTNKNGKLYTLVYGNPAAVHVDPIEKKPLFHFLPGTKAFSVGTAGCNLRCLNCQNWEISQEYPERTTNMDLMPDSVVKNAADSGSKSIAYTYNEPIAFYEYMYETSKLARDAGIKNVMVTNGYILEEAHRDLAKYTDAASINLKSFSEDTYGKLNSGHLQPVLDTLKRMKEMDKWFEVINLVVPTWTDDMGMIKDMSQWLYKNIGPDYPLHFTRFFPMYKVTHLNETPLSVLEQARKTALDEGLHFVYIGNVPGTDYENTYCPKCSKLIVERKGYVVTQQYIVSSACKFCGEKIAGVWEA
jgi:pyruvate formate lyase activating enzyme